MFLEDATCRPRKGSIAVMEIRPDGTYTSPETVIEQDYHMSYPCIFRHDDSFFMIPETYANNSIDLYHCVRFPDQWELHSTLMSNVKAADATVYEVNGTWWMFVAMACDGSLPNDELFLFHAESPFGPWLPHKNNPVVSDVRCARPAGRPFVWNGKLMRLGQDSSGGIYGRAISIQEVLRLTADEYEEREVGRIEPEWAKGLTATHTLNSAGGLTVIDGSRSILRR